MAPVYHDRLLALGFTGSGKSELLNVMFSQVRTQKLLVDTKPEFKVVLPTEDGERELEPVHDVADIDWTEPVIHFQDRDGLVEEFEELFAACYTRRNLVLCVHELADLCEESPGKTPRHVNKYYGKGRARGLGILGGSQRPVNMPKRALTETNHVCYFVPPLSADDHDLVSRTIGEDRHKLRFVLDKAHGDLGDYSYLQWEKKTRELRVRPPLPEHLRSQNIVRRTLDV